MTSLRAEPFMVSMVQVAATLPMAMLALPAGVLADLVDRRRYLLTTQLWMMISSLSMGILTCYQLMTPTLLLACTFIMGVGVALNSPGWHSITPEIVSRKDLPQAITLNGLVLNGAKALGPALGGLVLLYLGTSWAFFIDSATFLTVIGVLLWWKRSKAEVKTPQEKPWSALRVGLRHVRNSPPLRAVILRTSSFLLSSSALWSLLPLLSRQEYNFDEWGYSKMITYFGLGAALGAVVLLPRLRSHLSLNQIVTISWLIFAATLLVLSFTDGNWVSFLAMAVGGGAWLCILSSLYLVVQSSAPPWVQARAMSIYLLSFFAAASLGSGGWGLIASHIGLRPSLEIACLCLTITSLSSIFFPLDSSELLDLNPSNAWPHPEAVLEPSLEHGPIIVTVEYRIDPKDAEQFRQEAQKLHSFRLQNGVLRWGLFVDTADPGHYSEVYLEENWGAHLRHHQRVTAHETTVAQKVYAFHRGPSMPPVVHHAYCTKEFPADDVDKLHPLPKAYPTTDYGVPLWFAGDLGSNPKEVGD